MNLFYKFAIGFGVGLALSHFGVAGEEPEGKIEALLRGELAKRFAGAAIDFLPGSSFPVERAGAPARQVRILSESGTGTADYSVAHADGSSSIGQARFTAMVPTLVATRRIRPGEKLIRGDFVVQPVNVAQGLAYQFRGVMLSAKGPIEGLQARQTILEGQYPLSSGVERVPDIRRGDVVQLKILSGEIQLVTHGLVQEPGYLDERVRVLTQKTKKELTGQLRAGGVVEVRL